MSLFSYSSYIGPPLILSFIVFVILERRSKNKKSAIIVSLIAFIIIAILWIIFLRHMVYLADDVGVK